MKTSLIALAVTLILVTAGWTAQNTKGAVNHADCLSQEDVTWYQNRSKSGIARTCTDQVMNYNLNRMEMK